MLTASFTPPTFGEAMLTASRLPATFGCAMVTASLLATFGCDMVTASLALATLVVLTFVTFAFLATARLLIRDFFSIDMVAAPRVWIFADGRFVYLHRKGQTHSGPLRRQAIDLNQ